MKGHRALITGVNGLIGSNLAKQLHDAGHTVIGIGRQKTSNLPLAAYRSGDLTNKNWVSHIVADVQPDWIFHLAGCSSIRASNADPIMAYMINVAATAYLLDAVRQTPNAPRVLLASSAEVYAHSQQELSESSPSDPKSTYAFTKLAAEQLGTLYSSVYGVDVLSLRFFYSIGGVNKGAIPPTIPSGYAYRLAQCELIGSTQPLHVGVLSNTKDFIDVRDLATASIAAAQRGKKGEIYNVCKGKATSFEEIITALSALSPTTVDVIRDESFIRPWEPPLILGSHEKLTADTGWQPRFDILRDTLPKLLDYWRNELKT